MTLTMSREVDLLCMCLGSQHPLPEEPAALTAMRTSRA